MGRLLVAIAALILLVFGARTWLLERAERRGAATPAAASELSPGGRADVELASPAADAALAGNGEREPATARAEGAATASEAGAAGSIVARLWTEPIYPVLVQPSIVTLRGGSLSGPLAGVSQPETGDVLFPDLAPGAYTLIVDDPRFERLEMAGLRPGATVERAVRGSAALALDVVDADTGAPLARWSLELRADGADFRPAVFALGERTPATARVDSLVPHDYVVIVSADGYPRSVTRVPALGPGEDRAVRVELSARGAVSGVVLDETTGGPLAGAPVELYRADGVRRIDWWRWWGNEARAASVLAKAESDEHGRFRLPTNFAGRVTVRAIGGEGIHVLRELERAAFDESADIRLVVPPRATIAWARPRPGLGGLRGPRGPRGERKHRHRQAR